MINVEAIAHLFQVDDGSLPDIFVKKITTTEVEGIYDWILEITSMSGSVSVWSVKKEEMVEMRYQDSMKAYNKGEIESFRHSLENLVFHKTTIPDLVIGIVGKEELSFDYRMGKHWRKQEINALLEFLRQIKQKVPHAQITQADEGCSDTPNDEFLGVLNEYIEKSKND